MIRFFLLTLSMVAGLAAFFVPGLAAVAAVCQPRDVLLANLAGKFHEVPAGAGLSAGGQMVELITSPDGGTWTIITSTPAGMSCVVAVGEAWSEPPPSPVPKKGAPS